MLPVKTAVEIVETLERDRSALKRPALAFDADGTLWTGDIGIELFQAFLEKEALREKSLEPLRQLADRFAIQRAAEPTEQARLLFQGFHEGKLPEDLAFAMMAWAFAGYRAGELDIFITSFLEKARLESRLQRELSPILDWAKKASVPVYIVSASPKALIASATRRLGIEVAEIVAMTPGLLDDEIEPWVEEPLPYGEGKVEAFLRVASDIELLAAFGDSGYDAALLSLAKLPVAVRPKPSLMAKADDVRGLVRIAEHP